MIKVGIIGCGKIAQVRHIPEYLANDSVEIAAYFDRNTERALAISHRYGGSMYTSYEALIEDESIDAISVCAANVAHAEITIAALKAGKHVLCEKPMALSVEECEAMVAAAKQYGKKLMIGHNQRLAKAHMKAKLLISEGAIGDIVSFKTNFAHSGPENWSINPGANTWFFDKSAAGLGAMADLGIHKTDLIHFLTGYRIVQTTAFVGTVDKKDPNGNLIGVDDNAICIYQLENGAIGSMNVSWTCYGEEDNSTIIYGTKGVMKIYVDPQHSIVIERLNHESVYYDIDQIQTNENQTSSGVIDLFVKYIDPLAPSDNLDISPDSLSGEEALASMRVIFASVDSARLNRTVTINHLEKGGTL
ncbi:Gfo/Idh/MocA family protein [Fusibacter bizertensis]